jgi:hypothetical protein
VSDGVTYEEAPSVSAATFETPSVSEGTFEEPRAQFHEPPTEPAAPQPVDDLQAAPETPSVSEGILEAREELPEPPPVHAEPEAAPPVEPVHVEEPPAPQQVAVAVALSAAPRPIEQVVVSIDADVIHAQLTPADVAAFVGAARAPRPETFGILLDAALDL